VIVMKISNICITRYSMYIIINKYYN